MTEHELDWSKSAAIMVLEEFRAQIKNRAEILHRIDYLEVEFGQVSPKSKFHQRKKHPFNCPNLGQSNELQI